MIEVDFFYEEGQNGPFMPILRDVVIENLVLTNGAPLAVKVKGYPQADTSIIRISLRNISFSGITEAPGYVVEDVNELLRTEVYVNGEPWNSSGVAIISPTLGFILFLTMFCKNIISLVI